MKHHALFSSIAKSKKKIESCRLLPFCLVLSGLSHDLNLMFHRLDIFTSSLLV